MASGQRRERERENKSGAEWHCYRNHYRVTRTQPTQTETETVYFPGEREEERDGEFEMGENALEHREVHFSLSLVRLISVGGNHGLWS